MDCTLNDLGERYRSILLATIHSHAESAEPVGSRTISKRYDLGLSPATIRNVMADLEEMGFLTQPHPSAGRVPTDQAYRIYVNSLFDIPPLTQQESELIDRSLKENLYELDHVMETASKILSVVSRQTGMVFLPRISHLIFKRIEFIKLRPTQAMAILVAESGLVHNKIIEMEEDISQEKLEDISRYLNEEFGGLALHEIRMRIYELMVKEKEEYDQLLQKAMALSRQAFAEEEIDGEIYMGGTLNILEQPEFSNNIEKMKAIFKAFEEKSNLIRILDRCIEGKGLSILIGSESEVEEMQDCSIVAHTYMYKNQAVGTLGILGPRRMEYPRIIAIVDYIAKAVSRILTGN